MGLQEYFVSQYINTAREKSLRMCFTSVLKKNQERPKRRRGLRCDVAPKIPSYVFHLLKSVAATLLARLFAATDDSESVDYCEEDNTELEVFSNCNKTYTDINKGSILSEILMKIVSTHTVHEMISIKGVYFTDSGLDSAENDDIVRGEHSKKHPKDSVEKLFDFLIKETCEKTLIIHYVTSFELPTQIISRTHCTVRYSNQTQIFNQNIDPCFVDLKHFQEKLTAICGASFKFPDIDLSDIDRHELYRQTLKELEKSLQDRPLTDDSTGCPDESNMQSAWKHLEKLLLQRFEIAHLRFQSQTQFPFINLREYFQKLARGEALSQEEEMRYEGLRFASFNRINVETSSLRLAAAGFYATGDGDETRCFSCRVRYRNWQLRDNPFVIHSRISPNCIHATGTDERNVPIQLPSEGATVTPPISGDGTTPVSSEPLNTTQLHGAVGVPMSNTEETYNHIVDEMPHMTPRQPAHYSDSALPSSSSSTLRFEDAVHPHYSNSGNRLESFRMWPEGHTHNPKELVSAGFFYAGYSDCVRCFVCGLGLRTWEEGDDPWVEHVRWRSSCAYVEAARGRSFIIQTLAAIGRSTHTAELNPGGIHQGSFNNRHNYDTSREGIDDIDSVLELDEQSSADILRTSACARALEMGFSRGQVMSAAQFTIASVGKIALTLDALLERLLVVGSRDEVQGAQGGYSDVEHHSQEHNGLVGKVTPSGLRNMDSRSSGEQENTITRQAHLLESPAGSTDSGYKSVPVQNHVRQPTAQQTSGDGHAEHSSTNIIYNLDIAGKQSQGAEDPVTEDRGRPKESNTPLNRFSSLPTNRHEIKKIDKIQKTDHKKGKRMEDIQATEEETRQLRESSACKICLEDPANIVFLPCGHLVACAVCSPALERCPVCRTHIRGTVRVHRADMISREKHINHL